MAAISNIALYGLGLEREKFIHHLEKFAALVASAEREACAELCVELAPSTKTMTAYKVLHEASKAILARGLA